ncbi:hypothetical protein D6C78_11035 [Aureobasidium pullulans]|uniref:Uncharacterized protein n=1 Tax=Aureobasidium pullulans TaxID=5580 RepID=A0A4T0B306_AURPU|nr:hypothetical protein D6C78_11035 [Aureobasidium pullulans]
MALSTPNAPKTGHLFVQSFTGLLISQAFILVIGTSIGASTAVTVIWREAYEHS